MGELCLLRLFSGMIKPGDEVANPHKRGTERIGPKGRGEGFEFLNEVVGGNITINFIPAYRKRGCRNAMPGAGGGLSGH